MTIWRYVDSTTNPGACCGNCKYNHEDKVCVLMPCYGLLDITDLNSVCDGWDPRTH